MKKLQDLIDDEAKGWALVEEWLAAATNEVEVLESEIDDSEEALVMLQVSTEAPLGAIVYESGGILIDGGWIRLYGGSCDKLKRSLPAWNQGRSLQVHGEHPPFLLIGEDVLGGVYAINSTGLGDDYGNVYYYAFDTREWEPLDMPYSEFVWWTFTGDIQEYYSDYRWKGWKKDLAKISADEVFAFDPPFSVDGPGPEQRKRSVITARESYRMMIGETGPVCC